MATAGPRGIELNRRYEDIIGDGSFGVVYKGRLGGRPVAVKVINRHWNQRYWDKLKNEVILLQKNLRHPNVIDILKYEDKYPPMPEVWIAMELCRESLESYLKSNSLNLLQILDILWQSANGLSFLHDNHLVHRDIKPDNFLITLENSAITVKVTDFSLSKDIEGLLGSESTTVHGNRHWLAPEMFDAEGEKADSIRFKGPSLQQIDVFSFAILMLYTCLTKEGREAICRKYELGSAVKLGKDVLAYFSSDWSSVSLKQIIPRLLTKMLSVDAGERPSMGEVCKFLLSHRQHPAPLLKPPIASTAPRLVAQTSHLLGFDADPNIGIGGSHLVMLGSWPPRTVHLLQLTGDGYKELWQKELPSGMKYDDKKFVMGDESFVTSAQRQGEPARCWSAQLGHTHPIGGNLKLEAALPPHTLVARNGDALVLYSGDERIIALKAPMASPFDNWSFIPHISMCRHPESGWLAVTHHFACEHSLAVYNSSGELQHSAPLNYYYEPGRHVALACTASHLVVSEHDTTMLHLNAWNGKKVGGVNLGQVAKLREGEDKMHSVGVSQGNMLHVAVGKFSFHVTSLYALRIQ